MSNPAPGALERVRGFVNTWDAEDETDAIASPDALRDWLAGQELLDAGAKVTRAEHERALAVREALRATLRAHHGHPDQEIGQEVLADASQRAKLQVLFDDDGVSRLEPAADGLDGALGRLLTIAHEADSEGRWTRLKICPADDCQWAFYDQSRNRSATWCDMKVCGNRHKVREYRQRRLSPS
ncbi:MAG: CGNR zinc finger domain-containing protein [Solirubrobacteraceae bacterium]